MNIVPTPRTLVPAAEDTICFSTPPSPSLPGPMHRITASDILLTSRLRAARNRARNRFRRMTRAITIATMSKIFWTVVFGTARVTNGHAISDHRRDIDCKQSTSYDKDITD